MRGNFTQPLEAARDANQDGWGRSDQRLEREVRHVLSGRRQRPPGSALRDLERGIPERLHQLPMELRTWPASTSCRGAFAVAGNLYGREGYPYVQWIAADPATVSHAQRLWPPGSTRTATRISSTPTCVCRKRSPLGPSSSSSRSRSSTSQTRQPSCNGRVISPRRGYNRILEKTLNPRSCEPERESLSRRALLVSVPARNIRNSSTLLFVVVARGIVEPERISSDMPPSLDDAEPAATGSVSSGDTAADGQGPARLCAGPGRSSTSARPGAVGRSAANLVDRLRERAPRSSSSRPKATATPTS